MHLVDGILSIPVTSAATAVTALGIYKGLKFIKHEEIPKVALLSSVFFVGSLVQIPIGVTSVHLLFIGLMGILLGWASFPAFFIAYLLQFLMFGYGGITSLGANVFNTAVPATLIYIFLKKFFIFGIDKRAIYFAIGFLGILLSCISMGALLIFSQKEYVGSSLGILISHLPLMVIEGFITTCTLSFVNKIKSDLIIASIGK